MFSAVASGLFADVHSAYKYFWTAQKKATSHTQLKRIMAQVVPHDVLIFIIVVVAYG